MILSRDYLQKLVRQGKASYCGGTAHKSQVHDQGYIYIAVDRHDLQRTDHYAMEVQ